MTNRRKRPTRPASAAADPPATSCPIVGIGASAGGLDAFKKFFAAMPPDAGLAFVLIPHLDPTHDSLMVELLTKQTAMSVAEAADGTRILADHVYVIPPNKYLAVHDGVLQLSRPPTSRGQQTAIDFCLRSLAADQQERSIGIIFSGTGSHGTLGLKEIKFAGGMVMVQDPESAEYDQMPRSAIATGLVDYVLPPTAMPEALVRYVEHPYLNPSTVHAPGEDGASDQLNRILAVLRTNTKYDFRVYRKHMVKRRVQRRMGLCHIATFAEYEDYLCANAKEVTALYKDMLINVTGFFRDPEAFEVLSQRVVPELVERASADRAVRVWVPGCATGEEAYSLAILLVEGFRAADREINFQIFATDLDEDSLERARAGLYADSVVGDLSPARLRRFFTRADEQQYQAHKELRDAIVFAPQNLISDAPFSKLDLISCRNLLIYLEPKVQEKVVSLFHFSLNVDGYLLLGPSESIGRMPDLFEPISKKWRVYRRVGPVRREIVDIPIVASEGRRFRVTGLQPAARRARPYAEVMEEALVALGPAAVLMNRKYEVLCHHGPTVQYLEFPPGEPTQDLMSLIRDGLRTKVRAACRRAMSENVPVSEVQARVKRNGRFVPCAFSVQPILEAEDAEGLLLLTFRERELLKGHEPAAGATTPEESTLVQQLEVELAATREDLQSTIEETEASNEELRASNEEVMSMNEELQSANEELETSKEELQSLNEELSTVNNQLEDKVLELDTAHSDITGLLKSSEIATLFLDRELRVRRFTPAIGTLLHLVASDVGRAITDFSTRFLDPALVSDCRLVLEQLIKIDKEVWSDPESPDGPRSEQARWYLRRILPYRTEDNRIEGVVVTFIDITDRLKHQADSLETERLRRMVEHLPAGAVYVANGEIEGNREHAAITGYASGELHTVDDWFEKLLGGRQADARRLYESDYRDGFPERRLLTLTRKDGTELFVEFAAHRFDHHAVWLLHDVTDRERARLTLQAKEAQLRAVFDTAADAIVTTDERGTIRDFNRAAERMFGYATGEVVGQNIELLIAEPYRTQYDGHIIQDFAAYRAQTRAVDREMRARRRDGTTLPVDLSVSEIDHQGWFTSFIRDLSDRQSLERRLAAAQADERESLERDLHDGLGGQITGLAMLASSLKAQTESTGSPLAARVEQLIAGFDELHEQVRQISRGLTPVEAVPEGLMVALSELASQCTEVHHVACEFECDPPVWVSDPGVANGLFRIAQEAVTNAVRHGEPDRITIGLGTADDTLRLVVTDDGSGLEEPEDHTGTGLMGMRQRAALMDAELTAGRGKDGGTEVSLVMPWNGGAAR